MPNIYLLFIQYVLDINPMELRHLRYFMAVAEELSFTRAARRLHIAQPPLSMQIKALETELGVQLFERSSRAVRLTHAGKTFVDEARSVLHAAAHAEQRVKQAEQGIIGTLRIGVIAPAANARLAEQLRQYRRTYPEVSLSFHEHSSSTQIELLLAEQIDVGLLRPPVGHRDLKSRFVSEAPMVLGAPSGHRLAKAARIRWQDFDGESLITLHPNLQHGYYDKFLTLCAEAGARPTVGQYANDVQTVLWLVSAGLGLSPVTQPLAEISRPGLVFRDLPPGVPMVQTMIVWKANNTSPLVQRFLEGFADQTPIVLAIPGISD